MGMDTAAEDVQRMYLIFRTAEVAFACDFADVIKIEPADGHKITPAPGFPEYMPGTAELDGAIAPVIDTAARFGLGGRTDGRRSCFILAGIDRKGSEQLTESASYDRCAVLVDEVCGSETVGRLLPPPAVNSESFSRYLKGVFTANGETVYVVSPEKLIGD